MRKSPDVSKLAVFPFRLMYSKLRFAYFFLSFIPSFSQLATLNRAGAASFNFSMVSQNRFSWLTTCIATLLPSCANGKMVGFFYARKSAVISSNFSFGACNIIYFDSAACCTPWIRVNNLSISACFHPERAAALN